MSEKQTGKDVLFAISIALLWSIEGNFIFIDPAFKGNWYMVWSAWFCITHPYVFGKAIEATDLKKKRTLFICIAALNLIASGIAGFYFIRCGKGYYVFLSVLKMLVLWLFYRHLQNSHAQV